ncbi:glycosyltransferase family protein [Mucilaginibacter sp. RS28]|uniref:Glycosyltransferase family protein n=2 Tax=Mucilaginibacter straminoryzae TaxID=2932774 RepID=A0A9X1X6I6_9SPHI|nr:glycosyltransferase family protein [Mucilaginibacter straminoryzae]
MRSTRLPGKVMMPILGQTLLSRMIERLQMVKHRATILVATSLDPMDDAIENETALLGLPCFRGSENNLLERHYQAALLHKAHVVLKIPSDCPLIDPAAIDEVLGFYLAHADKYDYVSNLHPATWPDGNDVEVMSIDCLAKAYWEAGKPLELEHTTPYIWENPDDFRIGNVVWETGLDYSMSHRFTIDYEADYEFIKRVFEELYPINPQFSCGDILNLLEQKPEIYQINAAYAGVNWYRNHLDELKTITAEQTRDVSTENGKS